MEINIQLLHKDAIKPAYATDGAIAADVHACIDSPVVIHPGDTSLIPLGFAMEVPAGYGAFLLPRSGLGAKDGIVLGNLVGAVDQDYRQEVKACLWNRNAAADPLGLSVRAPFTVYPNDRIGQMVIIPIARVEFNVVEELSKTARAGGFGHTGVAAIQA